MEIEDDVRGPLSKRLRSTFARTAEVLAGSARLSREHAERSTDVAQVTLERERERRATQAARRARELAAKRPQH